MLVDLKWACVGKHIYALWQKCVLCRQVLGRRARDEERVRRFVTQRQKPDVVSLDAQVKDNCAKRDAEAATERRYAEQASRVGLMVEERRVEDEAEKRAQMRDLRSEWDEAASRPKNETSKRAQPLALGECGLAAAQTFSGEDAHAGRRKARQAHQMRTWCEQTQGMSAAKRAEEKEEEMRARAAFFLSAKKRGEKKRLFFLLLLRRSPAAFWNKMIAPTRGNTRV